MPIKISAWVPIFLCYHANSMSLNGCIYTGSLILISFPLIGLLTSYIKSFHFRYFSELILLVKRPISENKIRLGRPMWKQPLSQILTSFSWYSSWHFHCWFTTEVWSKSRHMNIISKTLAARGHKHKSTDGGCRSVFPNPGPGHEDHKGWIFLFLP
jgi:hypothetical protein